MDKRKIANQLVKDRLFSALVDFAGEKDWSKVKVTELIEKSGVARASFYRNFKSVEEIIGYGIHKLSLEYHEKMPALTESPHSREMILYKFRFYREHADLVLAFHHAKISTTLLMLSQTVRLMPTAICRPIPLQNMSFIILPAHFIICCSAGLRAA